MTEIERYHAIIIGSGQGGTPLARAFAGAGFKTALVEREHVGGTCVNVGCTPTKTMVASAKAADVARRAGEYGVEVGDVRVSMEAVRARKRAIVERFNGGMRTRLENTEHLALIDGEARFVDANTVAVSLSGGGEKTISGEKIFIDTGARPSFPPIEGIEGVGALTSTSVMELDEVPAHLVVLGGGPVGLEFAQMFRRFGSEVTIVERAPRLLSREDEDVANAATNILEEDGIRVLCGAKAKQAARVERGGISLVVEMPQGGETLVGSHLLVAAGRAPNTDMLNLGAAGVKTDERGLVPVNEKLETNVPHIYALGDVKGGPAFTHISYDDFRVIKANVLDGGSASTKDRLVPYVIYMDPELARVGLSERDAREAGKNIKVATMPMESVARALEANETRGFMKAVVDADTDKILGCAILGMWGGEIMSQVSIAMMGGMTYQTLKDGIFAHPTLAEALNNLFSAVT